ncbi:MAG TPA: sirohydrochlorin cobaltochelatase [Desulfotignum sp.]|jgi:sirohydrochlorin cobaltochelatase|nr:sirohydrochlorin cobaltochelatase [Desulfotignum sp.]
MHPHGYIGRKMQLPQLKAQPAVVIAAFGSTTRARSALDIFEARLKEVCPDHEIFWAYTSEIIRKKTGLPSLQQTLAQVEAQGFRRAVVQPLHVFPGTEYCQMAETCAYFPGLRVFMGETLFHRWEFITQTLEVLSSGFLPPEQGLNLLALHGTPLAADPVNVVYLGLEKLVRDRYPNVLAAAIEGIPDHEAVFARIRQQGLADRFRQARIIPMMYFAGMHAREDLMGSEDSWRTVLENMGFKVDCPMVLHGQKPLFKGLAHYPEVIGFLMERLERVLSLAACY